jgi:hypothetical protein
MGQLTLYYISAEGKKTFKLLYERMIAMLLGFVFFVGIFEFAGVSLFAKIVLGLLLDCALWAFVFRREIRSIRNALIWRRRRDAELRARAEAKHAKRETAPVHRTSAASYYYF